MLSVINHDRPPIFQAELLEMYALRESELGIGHEELDEEAIHHVAFSSGLVVAAGRSRPDSAEPDAWLAERIVVRSDFQDPGLAQSKIVEGLLESVKLEGGRSFDAQVAPGAVGALRNIGFVATNSLTNRQLVDVHKFIEGNS